MQIETEKREEVGRKGERVKWDEIIMCQCVTLCVQIKMYISLLQTCFVHLSTQCVVSMQRLVSLACCLSGEEEQEKEKD